MEQALLAQIRASQGPPPWPESSLFWGLIGVGVGILFFVVPPSPGLRIFLLVVMWLCFSGSCWIAFREYEPKQRRVGTVLGSLLIAIPVFILWTYTGGQPVGRLLIENERTPHSFIPQDNQASPPKARRIARIKVVAEGKSVANVRASVSKINGADRYVQLYISSKDTVFKFPQSFRLQESTNLNSGDEAYFDLLIECNGAVCTDGRLAFPSVENGERFYSVVTEGGVDVEPRTLTIKVTGDGVVPVTRDFSVLREGGKLLLKPQSEDK